MNFVLGTLCFDLNAKHKVQSTEIESKHHGTKSQQFKAR